MTYELIRSKRKTIALQVDGEGKVIVRAPLRAKPEMIDRFFVRYRRWVVEKQAQVAQHKQEAPPKSFGEGDAYYVFGRLHTLQFARTAHISFRDGVVYSPNMQPALLKIKLKQWYALQTKSIVQHYLSLWSQKMQVQPTSISVTRASRQWGACSVGGKLYFSWRLSMAPLALIEYVVVHELAHLVHHNHSKAFWKKIESAIPDYKKRRKLLQQQAFKYKF